MSASLHQADFIVGNPECLGRLQHPRIVQYLGVQKTSDRILIFMEYMTGGSLKDHIALVGSLSDPVARNHTAQVREIRSLSIVTFIYPGFVCYFLVLVFGSLCSVIL